MLSFKLRTRAKVNFRRVFVKGIHNYVYMRYKLRNEVRSRASDGRAGKYYSSKPVRVLKDCYSSRGSSFEGPTSAAVGEFDANYHSMIEPPLIIAGTAGKNDIRSPIESDGGYGNKEGGPINE